jgi:3-mercaptopyruvate sulfurtransferase SseA
MTDSTTEILDSLEPLFKEAEEKGLWFFCGYQGLWFKPSDLKQLQKEGRFIWGKTNWSLLDPNERTKLLKKNIENAMEELKDWKQQLKASRQPMLLQLKYFQKFFKNDKIN